MTPRVTLLIIFGVVVYVSLSLYHWRQVKKIPGAEKQSRVHSVLTRENQGKNWVQVSTSPGLSGKSASNIVPTEPVNQVEQRKEQPAPLSTVSLPEIPLLSSGDEPAIHPDQEQKAVDGDNKELLQPQQDEKSISLQQSQEINDLRTQIISLRSALEDSLARLQEKNVALEKLKNQSPQFTAKSGGTDPEDNRIKVLKTSLASKLDALAKANARITGLSELLDQSRSTIAEVKDTNAHLERVLSNTEIAQIKTRQEADKLNDELILAREDREKYLAETGRLHVQLQQARTRLARLESELNEARLKAEAMLRYGQEQTELITPFRQQIEILNARVEDKNGDLIEAEEQITLLEKEERALQEKVQTLQLELLTKETINKELQETSQALDNAQKHSAELTVQLKVLAEQLNAKNALINNLNQDLAQAQSAARDAALHKDALQKETEQQQQELDAARQSLTAHRQQLDRLTSEQQGTETKLNEVGIVNEQLGNKIAEQGKLLEAARTEAAQLASQLNEKDNQLAAANEALLRSQATVKELKTAENTAAEATSPQANETIKQLKKTLDSAQSRLTETDTEMQMLKKSLAQAQRQQTDTTETNRLQEEIDQLRKTIAEHDKQQEVVEQVLSGLKLENTELQKKISEAENNKRNRGELQSALEQKTRELYEEKERMSILENKAADLRSDLDRREIAFFNMQEEYTSLQDRHDSLQKERDALLLYTLDSDNDTISDAEDTCPGTVSGAEVGPDGCERDSDNDGLVDRLDLCPEAPGQTDTNPFGCARGAPIVLSGIFFSGGNTALSPASRSYLDKVAAVLQLFEDIHFEIAGYTDNIGETARNLTVSKQRADAVKNYLVGNGIKASRLVPVGYGSDRPVADNDTAEGRAANRRVELKIISPNDAAAAAEKDKPTAAAEEEGLPVQ